jgi:hypothetical protein
MYNFPCVIREIPRINTLVIFIDDSVHDGRYNLSWTVQGFPETDVLFPLTGADDYKTEALFQFIQGSFFGNSITYECIDVTANMDSAILLKDFIDSWISEKKIMVKAGTWNGA